MIDRAARSRLFGARSFANGRARVYGCSPGCILVSLVVSIAVTIFLNLLLHWF